jgi:hypothetical protein
MGCPRARAEIDRREAHAAALRRDRIDATVRARMREIDHEIRMEALDRERVIRCATQDALEAARDDRAQRRVHGKTMGDRWRMVRAIQASPDVAPNADVLKSRKHAEQFLQTHGIAVEVAGHWARGTAWPARKLVRVPWPIRSEWDLATFGHESWHLLLPCRPDHRRVRTEAGDSVCVQCEIACWLAAVDSHPIVWGQDAHDNLAQGLASYRVYGTPDQQRQIDELIGPTGYRRMRLRRLIAEHPREG